MPPILHDFPAKHYKYIPNFDEEFEELTAEKHLQAFEYLSDLFEIEQVGCLHEGFHPVLARKCERMVQALAA